jgi:hypothetical protein
MGQTLTQQQIDTIEEIARVDGWNVRSYQGRGMWHSESCLGIVLDSSQLFNLGAFLYQEDKELAELLMQYRCRIDSMGRDSEVAYWPSLSVTGTSLEEDNDEDDDDE